MDLARKKYIEKIASTVLHVTAGTKLFPSLMIAQACLEGENGVSDLARKYHNHFGIKVSRTWGGAWVDFKSGENSKSGASIGKPVSSFRVYASLLDGFNDRCKFLQVNKRYTTAGVFTAKTPELQATALKTAGYATDPLYVSKLATIIRIYDLKKYDVEALKKKL